MIKRTVLSLFCIATALTLSACSGGGMSDADVEVALVAFFADVDQAYTDAGAPPYDQPEAEQLAWMIDLETKQRDHVDKTIAAHTYPAEVQKHLTQMQAGLSKRVEVFQSWADAGLTRDTAAPDEVTAVDDAAMQSTSAETQLRILAGL